MKFHKTLIFSLGALLIWACGPKKVEVKNTGAQETQVVSVSAYFKDASDLIQKQEYQKAVEKLEVINKADSSLPKVHFNLGFCTISWEIMRKHIFFTPKH